jgi:hypothetical protein
VKSASAAQLTTLLPNTSPPESAPVPLGHPQVPDSMLTRDQSIRYGRRISGSPTRTFLFKITSRKAKEVFKSFAPSLVYD